MLVAVTVENWRGLPKLELSRLGRVNLISGRGDVGKTSALEAVVLALSDDAFEWVPSLQEWRWGRPADAADYQGTWLPVFRGGNVVEGLRVDGRFVDGTQVSWSLTADTVRRGWGFKWAAGQRTGALAPGRRGVVSTPALPTGETDFWFVPARLGPVEESLALFARLVDDGRDGDLLDWMRQINPSIVKLHHEDGALRLETVDAPYPLPVSCFGDGTLRAFEVGCALLVADPKSVVAIDDLDSDFTDAALHRLWKWLKRIAGERDLQVFATTRRELCVEAACAAWRESGDAGLRIIRLERNEQAVTATTYDRTLLAFPATSGAR
jgi:hypothetical protein